MNLKDGPRQAIGERLIYDREPDMVVIWGYPEGGPRAAAEVYYEDPQTGRVQKQASPKIIWDRGDNRIMTEEAVGTGTR